MGSTDVLVEENTYQRKWELRLRKALWMTAINVQIGRIKYSNHQPNGNQVFWFSTETVAFASHHSMLFLRPTRGWNSPHSTEMCLLMKHLLRWYVSNGCEKWFKTWWSQYVLEELERLLLIMRTSLFNWDTRFIHCCKSMNPMWFFLWSTKKWGTAYASTDVLCWWKTLRCNK
jgi:hypothetical protein